MPRLSLCGESCVTNWMSATSRGRVIRSGTSCGLNGERSRTMGVRSVEPGLTSNAISVPAVREVELSIAYRNRFPTVVSVLTSRLR